MKKTALARMCMDELNREAMELTGYERPQTAMAKAKMEPVIIYTDPIIRQRMGLPSIVYIK